MQTFQEMKSQKIFIKKRNRIIQNGWRDGIVGVEQPGDYGSHFYSPEILKQEQKKAERLTLRNNCNLKPSSSYLCLDLQEKAGESAQIDFSSSSRTARKDNKVVEMHHGWTAKKISDVRFRDTHH